MLTATNYLKGFLTGGEGLLGGVAPHPLQNGAFMAYILDPETAEYQATYASPELVLALRWINAQRPDWIYESVSNCGGCEDGNCTKGAEGSGGCGLRKDTASP
jgi:hypothetical protein